MMRYKTYKKFIYRSQKMSLSKTNLQTQSTKWNKKFQDALRFDETCLYNITWQNKQQEEQKHETSITKNAISICKKTL